MDTNMFHITKGLRWYKRVIDPLTLHKIGWHTFDNDRKSCTFSKKEIVV